MTDYIKYLGHSAFYLKISSFGILLDPWFMYNKNVDFDLNKETVSHIVLSHGHHDHFGDTIQIAKTTKAEIIAIVETAAFCEKSGLNTTGVNTGSEINFNFGTLTFFAASHTNSLPNGEYGGIATSFIIKINGIKIFFAGDTGLTSDFELIGKLYKPEYAILPIGGFYTMGIEEAVIAANMLQAKNIIPMHYNTFEKIKANPKIFRTKIEENGKICHIMKINDKLIL